jgi:single-strand DNA-binding protein
MHLIGLARLGRDAELRTLQDGTAVANLALAFNYGKKDANGNRPTQWIDASLWNDRAERLAPHLLKGTQLEVHLSDPRVETYQKSDGTQGVKLVATVGHVEFASSKREEGQTGQQTQQRPAAQPPARNAYADQKGGSPRQQQRPAYEFSDMDDDIPF